MQARSADSPPARPVAASWTVPASWHDRRRGHLHPPDHVRVATEPDLSRGLVEGHVPDRVRTIRRDGDGFRERLLRRIEGDEPVGLHARLGEPDAAAVVERHRIRERAEPGWKRILL